MGQTNRYEGREQSLVKHKLFQRYLENFAHKIGSRWQSITYIDGFSGPWNTKDEELSDSSFAIAIKALREARDNPATRKLKRLRCVFVESNARKFKKLKAFADAQSDIEIKCIPGGFEDVIADVIQFVRRDPNTFAFTFIDPTGWTGFAMKKIQPFTAPMQRGAGQLHDKVSSFAKSRARNTNAI
jgi:three-Cys-motif partner protein